jgi:flagellar biosynthetic protein FliR
MEYFVLNFEKLMLVFVRILGLLFTAPFFDSESVPAPARLSLGFVISILIFPLVYTFIPAVSNDFIQYSLTAIGEALIGVAIGFMLAICFSVYQLAGQLFTVQMGFGASEVFDPLTQESLPIIGQFLYIMAILVFLALNGPALVIKEIYHSFELISFEKFINGKYLDSPYGIISIFADMFMVSVRISLPIIATLLIVTVAMGLLSKAAPQMNLLMVGFPVSIMVSFIFIILIIPNLINFIGDYLDVMFKNLWFLMMEINHG